MEKGELKIYYNNNGAKDEVLENALETLLKILGYKKWASGMEEKTGICDINFFK